MKVSISNFQSIENINFSIEGFTVIVGKNNIGKSAIIRAIDSALTNRSGSDFIRIGTTKTEITLDTENLKIKWEKGTSTKYVVNGTSYTKLNKTIPQPILDAGYQRIEVGDQKLEPLIAHQFEPLFLLDKQSSTITDVLSKLYKLDIIGRAEDLCSKEIRETKSTIKMRERDLSSIRETLLIFDGFNDIKNDMCWIEEKDTYTKKLKTEIQEVQEYITSISSMKKELKNIENILKVQIPSTQDISKLVQEQSDLIQLESDLGTISKNLSKLEDSINVEIPDMKKIEELFLEYDHLNNMVTDLQNISTPLKETKKRLEILEKIKKNSILNIEKQVLELEEINTYFTPLNEMIKNYRDLTKQLKEKNQKIEEVKNELSLIPVCPLCKRSF